MQGDKAQTVPMASVLQQLAKELITADQQIGAVEPLLHATIKNQPLSPAQLSELQGLDTLRQTLVCLELFLLNLAEAPESTFQINASAAAKALTLKALSERLASPDITPAARLTSGSLHLF